MKLQNLYTKAYNSMFSSLKMWDVIFMNLLQHNTKEFNCILTPTTTERAVFYGIYLTCDASCICVTMFSTICFECILN